MLFLLLAFWGGACVRSGSRHGGNEQNRFFQCAAIVSPSLSVASHRDVCPSAHLGTLTWAQGWALALVRSLCTVVPPEGQSHREGHNPREGHSSSQVLGRVLRSLLSTAAHAEGLPPCAAVLLGEAKVEGRNLVPRSLYDAMLHCLEAAPSRRASMVRFQCNFSCCLALCAALSVPWPSALVVWKCACLLYGCFADF